MEMIYSDKPNNPFSFDNQITNIYLNKIIGQFSSVLFNSIGGKDFLILVIGESQSGKTTLLTKLIDHIQENVKPCQLKIRESDDPSIKNRNHPAFLYNTENSQVIILDDAHKLNFQELSIILENAWDSKKETSQLILFCEPSINNMLFSLLKKMPKKTSLNKLYIPILDEQQTESYLNHYLKEFKLIDTFTFSKTNIKNIFKKSKGLPGQINLVAEEIFSKTNAPFKINKKSKSFFSPALIFIFIMLLLVSSISFIFLKKNDISSTNSNKKQPSPAHQTITKAIKPPVQIKSDNQEVVSPANINQIQTIQKSSATSTVSEVDIPKDSSIESSHNGIVKPKLVSIKSQKKPLILPKIDPIIFQEKWIMSQNPNLYTIQVMAAKESDSVKRFLKFNKDNQSQVAYYKMYFKNGTWYKFISGKFKTHEKANSACNNLPEKLKELGPWPRKFSSIQKDIDIGTFYKEIKE